MPGPVEVKITPHHQGPIEARRFPRLRELFNIGWHGTDVRSYLLDFKSKIAEPQLFNGSTEFFGKLTDLFFTTSSLSAKFKITDVAIYTAERELGLGIPIERRITPEVIDRVLEKISAGERYCYEDVLSLILKEAKVSKPAELDPFLLGRIENMDLRPQIESLLEKDVLTEPEKNLLRTMLELGMTAQLESLIKDIAKTEMMSPERLKCMEKILRGLVELGLPRTQLEALLKLSPDYLLRQAYIIGTLRMYAESGSMPLTAAQWNVLLSSLQSLFTVSSSVMPRLNSMEYMRLLILGIAGLGLSASEINNLLCEGMTKPVEFNFNYLIETGSKVDSLLNSLNSSGSGLDKYLAEYGKNEEITKLMDNTIGAADPIRATENIISNVKDVDNAAKLIGSLVDRASDIEDREDILDSLVVVVERSDIRNGDPRLELARKVIGKYPEGQTLLLLSHIGMQRDAIIADIPVIGYLSASKSTMNRIESELSSILAAGLSQESARALLLALREQAAQNALYLSEKISKQLADAFQKINLPELRQLMGYMDNIISNQLANVSFGLAASAMSSMLTRSSLLLGLSLMNIEENIAKHDLEVARRQAEAAAQLADAQSLRASVVRYLPGFVAASIEGRLSEKHVEEINIAIRTDKSRGLFIALDMVQGILKDEVLTELEHLFRKLSIFELPPRLAVLGNVLRMEKLIDRENRFRLAVEIVQDMEKSSIWLEALDLIATQQYNRLNQLVEKWVNQNYLSN